MAAKTDMRMHTDSMYGNISVVVEGENIRAHFSLSEWLNQGGE